MAEQVPAVSDVLDAIERRNWTRLRRLLHPDIHWTTAVEEQLQFAQPQPHTFGMCSLQRTMPYGSVLFRTYLLRSRHDHA